MTREDRVVARVSPEATIELALRRQLPLATLDRELRVAAKAEQVPLLRL